MRRRFAAPAASSTGRAVIVSARGGAVLVVLVLAASGALAGSVAADDAPRAMVSVGEEHSCALISGGAVECWGNNTYGQLGNGTTTRSATPVAVSGLTNAIAVSAGGSHNCAVLSGGSVECWGRNADRQLGNGTATDSSVPVAVNGLTNAIAVSAGGSHTCALLAGGSVACWGDKGLGELGDGTAVGSSATPVAVSGLTNATSVSAGWTHSCAVLSGGSVECWGSGSEGELGNGATDLSSSTPVAVSGLTNATSVSTGVFESCARLSGGTVECWGLNKWGSLGNGTTASSSVPVAVTGLTAATSVTVGDFYGCALLSGGGARCWGLNLDGQLGNGTIKDSPVPVVVSGLRGATAISAGFSHTCALRAGGTVGCWGDNAFGELGNGTTEDSTTPFAVTRSGARPVFGQTANLEQVSGDVQVKLPGASGFVPLTSAASVPVGTTVDTTGGKVKLTAAKDTRGTTQSGRFNGGIFRITQTRARSPLKRGRRIGLTVLTLTGPPLTGCGSAQAAGGHRRHPKTKQLFGSAKGNFETVGKYASGQVIGTEWSVRDSCTGTLVHVARGKVSVQDLVTHQRILVRAPHSYLARPRGA